MRARAERGPLVDGFPPMPPDILIKSRRAEPLDVTVRPAPASEKALVKCMVCGLTVTCDDGREPVDLGRAHTAETGHTRILITRSVTDAA